VSIMSRGRPVPHSEHVDIQNVQSCFFDERAHRAYLKIPFLGDRGSRSLCVIGQNPSAADEHEADSTIHYLEELVFLSHNEYRQIIILNLYSQVDTSKTADEPALHPECARIFEEIVADESDFLVVFGKLKNHRHYRFQDRAREIEPLLRSKHVFKLDVGTSYAPHPGNPKIIYNNFELDFSPYTFSDINAR
jgi:hypothetical protein